MRYKWGELITLEYGKPVPDKNTLDGKYPVFGTNGQIGTSNISPKCDHASFILGRKGAYRGVHYCNGPFSVIDTAFYVENKKPELLDLKWAYYKFLTYDINNMDSGSAIPSTDRYEIYSIESDIPLIRDQKKVVSILEKIDDKIALNQKINENLEQQAQALFGYYFGNDFEFTELGCVIKTTSGGTPSRKNLALYENATIPWVKSKELNGSFILDTEEKINELAIEKSSAKLLPIHSVLIAMYGATVGEYGIITSSMACNQAVCALLENKNYPHTYLFSLVKASKQYLKNMAVGSAQQNISQVLIKQIPVHTNLEKIRKYDKIVNSNFRQIETIMEENHRLSELRDDLLPKLMSGEIDVSEV